MQPPAADKFNMDKNTIIGLLLITAIIIGFSIYNRPSQEQIAAQKRMRDSLALVDNERAAATSNSFNDTLEDAANESIKGSNAADFSEQLPQQLRLLPILR